MPTALSATSPRFLAIATRGPALAIFAIGFLAVATALIRLARPAPRSI